MTRRTAALVALGAVLVALGVWVALSYVQPRREARALRDRLRTARAAVDSCRMTLSREQADFRAFDDRVDSLRGEVRGFESLHPEGVPADSFEAYMDAFDRYNEAVPRWRARADSLESRLRTCRTLADRHNALADSLRRILVEIGELPDTASGSGPSPE